MRESPSTSDRWQFWIDRGGTFTDVVGRRPDGRAQGIAVIKLAGEQHGDAPTMTEFFYTWPAVYVGYFFQRWMTPVFIAVTSGSYAATLAIMGLSGNVQIRWLLVTVVVAGLTVAAHAIRSQVNDLVHRLQETARTDTLTAMPNTVAMRPIHR